MKKYPFLTEIQIWRLVGFDSFGESVDDERMTPLLFTEPIIVPDVAPEKLFEEYYEAQRMYSHSYQQYTRYPDEIEYIRFKNSYYRLKEHRDAVRNIIRFYNTYKEV